MLYSAYQPKQVSSIFKGPLFYKSIDLKICMWHISEEQLILISIGTFLACRICHTCTEYIAIEDDNVMCPLFASFRNWVG